MKAQRYDIIFCRRRFWNRDRKEVNKFEVKKFCDGYLSCLVYLGSQILEIEDSTMRG